MKGPPLPLAILGLLGNPLMALALWDQGNKWALAFAVAAGISLMTVLDHLTAVRTAEKDVLDEQK